MVAPVIRLEDVSKTYPGTGAPAVDGVTLEVPRGKTLAMIGPSGCGKSTLLRLAIGLIWPDRGRVLFDGDPVTPGNVRHLRGRVGYVIQDGGLFPHLTARKNVELPARDGPARGKYTNQQLSDRVDELVDLTGFPRDGLDRLPSGLSGGQRQRVAVARALVLDPDVLLMDEPLGALDPMIRYDLQTDLRNIFRDLGKTVMIVTHDLAEAGYFGDESVLMRDGRIEAQGSLDDITHKAGDADDDFVQKFVTAQRGHSVDEARSAKQEVH